MTPVILATQEAETGRSQFEASLGKKQHLISKTHHTHTCCGVAQVVEHLPSKREAEFKPEYSQKRKKK
jgi:hypothetical protein